MEELKFALIGGGFMGKAHSLALANLPVHVWPPPALPVRELIADATDELAEDGRRRFGFNRATSDWRAAVEDPEIDVIDVVVPNAMHREVVLAAAEAGKHVICEKPLAADIDDAREMVEAVERAGVIHQTGFNWRLTPAVLQARKLIDEGMIGEVRDFRGFWLGDFGLDSTMPINWRFQRSTAGSGALGDLGSHVIDFARFLVGEPAEVVASERTYITERPLPDGGGTAPVDVDDATSFLVRFESGATGFIEASWASPGRKSHAGFEIHGSEGSLTFDWERMDELGFYDHRRPSDRRGFQTILVGPDQPHGEHFWPVAGYQLGYADTKTIQLLEFIEAVVAGGQARPSFIDGLRASLVEEAVIESARSGAWTTVENLAIKEEVR